MYQRQDLLQGAVWPEVPHRKFASYDSTSLNLEMDGTNSSDDLVGRVGGTDHDRQHVRSHGRVSSSVMSLPTTSSGKLMPFKARSETNSAPNSSIEGTTVASTAPLHDESPRTHSALKIGDHHTRVAPPRGSSIRKIKVDEEPAAKSWPSTLSHVDPSASSPTYDEGNDLSLHRPMSSGVNLGPHPSLGSDEGPGSQQQAVGVSDNVPLDFQSGSTPHNAQTSGQESVPLGHRSKVNSTSSSAGSPSSDSEASSRTFRPAETISALMKPLPGLPLPPTPPDTPEQTPHRSKVELFDHAKRNLALRSKVISPPVSPSSREWMAATDSARFGVSQLFSRPSLHWAGMVPDYDCNESQYSLHEALRTIPPKGVASSIVTVGASMGRGPKKSLESSESTAPGIEAPKIIDLDLRQTKTHPEAQCSLCLEPISSRLPGEKPHLMPDCGHAVHDACYLELYRTLSHEASIDTVLCKICRAHLKINREDNQTPIRNDDILPARGISHNRLQNSFFTSKGHLSESESARGCLKNSSTKPSVRVTCDRVLFSRDDISELARMTALITVSAKATSMIAPSADDIIVGGEGRGLVSEKSPSFLGLDVKNKLQELENATQKLKDNLSASQIRLVKYLGCLKLYHPALMVRKDALIREYQVYVFELAIICVCKASSKNMMHILRQSASTFFDVRPSVNTLWKIRGRIMIKHICGVQKDRRNGAYALNFDLLGQEMDSFSLEFSTEDSCDVWSQKLKSMLQLEADKKAHGSLVHSSALPCRHDTRSAVDVVVVLSLSADGCTAATWSAKTNLFRTALTEMSLLLRAGDRLAFVLAVDYTIVSDTSHRLTLATLNNSAESIIRGALQTLDIVMSSNTNDWRKQEGTSAIDKGLDILLQRRQRNPVSGILYLSEDLQDLSSAQKDQTLARAKAVDAAIHTFGFGKSHVPSLLVKLSDQNFGQYVYVKEWTELTASMKVCMANLVAPGLRDVKLYLQVSPDAQMLLRRVSGAKKVVLTANQLAAFVELGTVPIGSSIEVLLDLEIQNGNHFNHQVDFSDRHHPADTDRATSVVFRDLLVLSTELSCSIFDNKEAWSVKVPPCHLVVSEAVSAPSLTHMGYRMTRQRLYPISGTIEGTTTPLRGTVADDDLSIVRRRMEMLFCDMLAQCLALMRRYDHHHAIRVLTESCRIIEAAYQRSHQSCETLDTSREIAQGPERKDQTPKQSSAQSRSIEIMCALTGELRYFIRMLESPTLRTICARSMTHLLFVVRDQRAFSVGQSPEIERLFSAEGRVCK